MAQNTLAFGYLCLVIISFSVQTDNMYSSFAKLILACSFLLGLLGSCADEIVTDFPLAFLSEEENLLFSDTSLCVGQPFSVRVRMTAGSNNLTQFAVFENESLLSPDRITIEGSSSWQGQNPIALIDGEQQALNYLITINPLSDSTETKFYFFRTVDEINQPAVASVGLDIGFPTVELLDEPNVISSDSTLFIGEDLKVRLQLTACWRDLENLEVLEDGMSLPDAQIEIRLAADSSVIGNQNPFPIRSADRSGSIYDIHIQPSAPLVDSLERIYTFRLNNTRGQVGLDTIRIRYIEPTPLDLTSPIPGALLINQAAGEGNGGLDLDTGDLVDSKSEEAEIQDEGIILTNNPETNWRRQISVVNPEDTEMRKVRDGFELSDFTFKEQLVNTFGTSITLDGDDNFSLDVNGNATVSDGTQGEEVSQQVDTGDIFILRRRGKYYVFQCIEIINEIGDNQDRYVFDILY